MTIFWFLGILFRPPGTLYELNVGLCLLLLSPRSLARVRKAVCLVAVCAITVPVILYTVSYWMWLEAGSGEANFLYFQCLAYNVFVAMIALQFCAATVRRDKALRLTEKGLVRKEAAEPTEKATS
jgi:phosphatidylinositol glycan class U